jgi:hypothetical protein
VGGGRDPVFPFLVPLRPGSDGLDQTHADVLVQLVDRVVDRHCTDKCEDDRGEAIKTDQYSDTCAETSPQLRCSILCVPALLKHCGSVK